MRNIIPIEKIGELCKITEIPYAYFQNLLFLKIDPYRYFEIRKRKSNKKRLIHIPEHNLSTIQNVLYRYIVRGMDIHPCATAYVSGSNPIKNARFHCNAKTLIKLDIRDFFHSFDEYDLFNLFKRYDFNNLISFQLARLCVRVVPEMCHYFNFEPRYDDEGYIYPSIPKGNEYSYMPQGAITSPGLSNALMLGYDMRIEAIAKKYNVQYTRYSDDIFLSSKIKLEEKESISILNDIRNILNKKFMINNEKTKILYSGNRMIVTGLMVNNSEPRLLREYKNNFRLQVHYIKKNGFEEQAKKMNCDPYSFYNHIKGKLLWIKSVEPEFAEKMNLNLYKSEKDYLMK